MLYVKNIEMYQDIDTPKIELAEKKSEIICLGPAVEETDVKIESMVDFIRLCRMNGISFVNHTGKLFSKQTMDNKNWNTPDRFYIKSSKGNYETEEGLYLVLYSRSNYINNDALYEKTFQYIKENDLMICGNTYEEFPLDEISINNPDNYLVKVSVRVRQVGK